MSSRSPLALGARKAPAPWLSRTSATRLAFALGALAGGAGCSPRPARALAPVAPAPPAATTRTLPRPTVDANPRDVAIWRAFVARLRADDLTTADVDPYPELTSDEGFKETLLGFLRKMRTSARWPEWEVAPETHRVGDNVHVLAQLSEDGRPPAGYVFTFRDADGRWFFRHLEAITVRLDAVGPLPTSDFPDLPSGRKLWMAEEKRVTEQVRLFRSLAREKGRDFGLRWFEDGVGYLVGVKTWVPWVEPRRAFVLYLCWEQAKLRGDEVELRRLDDERAEVHLRSNFLLLYERTSHLAKMVSRDDFRALFESPWRSRVAQAGWAIAFDYGAEGAVTFRLIRAERPPAAPR